MSEFQFKHPYYLFFLTLLIPLALLGSFFIERQRKALIMLMGPILAGRAAKVANHHKLRVSLLLIVFMLGIIALAQPQSGAYQETVAIKGVDVIIAVDVSLSMLAADEPVSRLSRARRLTADLMEQLPNSRLGLVAFAGSSVNLLPLTLDRVALKTFVEALDARAVDNAGTSIDKAIARANQSFQAIGKQSRVLIIISDGEDLNDQPEAQLEAVATEAATNGITIITIGVGTSQGVTIPLEQDGHIVTKVDEKGNPVITKLNEPILQNIAQLTQGIYLHAQPDGNEVATITNLINKMEKGEIRQQVGRNRQERFQYPLMMAAILLVIEMTLASYRSDSSSASKH